MQTYPIHISEQEAAGYILYRNAIQAINAAFFDGFMTALLKSPENAEDMEPVERIHYCLMAAEKSAKLTRAEYPEQPIRTALIEDIKIYPCFEESPPSQKKMERKAQYFEREGEFQSEIVLDEDNYLIDGYTSYLLAKQIGAKCVFIRYGKRQVVRAYHRPGGKLYEWELPERLIDKVSSGDRVLVHTKGGARSVTVAAVEPYRPQEYTRALQMAVKVRKSFREGGVPV